ncbi:MULTISPECIES: ATP phosphoribosyltransferase regulatory subunit [Clostridium]|jgi:ATP phosphoribosyltransferase regulatory subunit|uniref:ATP phosphoribosyltransferase regulatory subunit n=1 Tax=Clostridium TaxID=1485 RepID=UPI000289FAE1|nr:MULTISPECIES: ATP phosphoribosyltransferase regulatory subunit [Clostridium]MDF2504813.1 phosphoribosyltransferase, regulatory subunit [Clostridium sp.]
MANLKKYIPDGTKDILFQECVSKVKIEDLIRDVYINYGYHEIISPTLEFYDVFNMENQPIPQEKMYKLFDNRGRILVLRSDMTTPIARIAATKIKPDMYPLKLCYSQNIFRVNEVLNGKLSEFTQSGIEIIGVDSIRGDIEAIITGIEALNKIGLKNFKIEIGDSQFFRQLTENLPLSDEDKESIRLFIQNKNIAGLREFLSSNDKVIDENALEILQRLPELFGGKEVITETRELLGKSYGVKALENIERVYEIMEKLGFSKYISIDLGMVQNLNYYSGLIFRGYCMDAGDSILSGGRYDKLIENFGEKLPATGLAINVDIVLQALEIQGKVFEYKKMEKIIHCNFDDLNKAYDVLKDFNDKGIKAEVSLMKKEEESLKYAEKINIKSVINVSEGTEFKLEDSKWIKESLKK